MLLLLLPAGCAETFDQATADRLDELMASSLARSGAPGMILGVWAPGQEYLRAIGLAELSGSRRMTATPLFRIGSLTKTYVGTAVLQLVDEKKVSLDDAIATHLPSAGVPGGDKITLEHLLMMTSGLPGYAESAAFGESFHGDTAYTPQQLLDYAWTVPVKFAPGTGFFYANTNTVLLGMLLEKLDGAPLASSLQRRIFDRLGLTETSFPGDGAMPGEYLHGYGNSGHDREDYSLANPSWAWAAGAIISTIADVRTYVEALGEGTLLGPEARAKRESDWWSNADGSRYGLAWVTFSGFYGHNGSVPGYVNMAMHDPGTKTTIVVMFNYQGGGSVTLEVVREAIKILFPERT